MTDKPLVSAVIASYNMAAYLPLAVESALAQTYENVEVVVIDDGSTDNTRKVIEPFLDNSRVKYFSQENRGMAAAKNRSIHEARGEYIAFLDADDMWTPNKLEWQLPQFENAAIGVVYGRVARIDESSREIGRRRRQYYTDKVTTQLLRENFVPFGTAVVRRQCLEEMGTFNESYRMGIDWDLWLRLSTRYEFGFVDAVVGLYRIWAGQMSVPRNWRSRYEHCFRILQDFSAAHPGLLPPQAIAEAWADTYVNRGRTRSLNAGEHLQALKDVVHAISYMPSFQPAWRAIGRILLNACSYRK